jgi:hypothetical protein
MRRHRRGAAGRRRGEGRVAVGLADPDAGGVVSEFWKKVIVALVFALAIMNAAYFAYRVGYADGARQAAPLAAPPTTTERAR